MIGELLHMSRRIDELEARNAALERVVNAIRRDNCEPSREVEMALRELDALNRPSTQGGASEEDR